MLTLKCGETLQIEIEGTRYLLALLPYPSPVISPRFHPITQDAMERNQHIFVDAVLRYYREYHKVFGTRECISAILKVMKTSGHPNTTWQGVVDTLRSAGLLRRDAVVDEVQP